jgi:hypothetical protein
MYNEFVTSFELISQTFLVELKKPLKNHNQEPNHLTVIFGLLLKKVAVILEQFPLYPQPHDSCKQQSSAVAWKMVVATLTVTKEGNVFIVLND